MVQGEPNQAMGWMTAHSPSVATALHTVIHPGYFWNTLLIVCCLPFWSHPAAYYKVLSNSLRTLSSNGSRVCLPTSTGDSSFSVETETEPRLIQVSSCHIPQGLQSKLAFVKNVYHDCKAAVFGESFQESLEITSWISVRDSYPIWREEQPVRQ